MKNLSFVLCLVLLSTTLFYSCGDDNNNTDDPQTETQIVQNGVKGKFYDADIEAYKFDTKNVSVWTNIFNNGEYYHYQNVKYTIYPEKHYIVIHTSPEILLYYELKGNNIRLYTDAEKTNEANKTENYNNYKEESKEPTNEETVLYIGDTTTDFNTTAYLGMETLREMYIKDAKGKTILTFVWNNYLEIYHIGNVGDIQNLVGFSPRLPYITTMKDRTGKEIDMEGATVRLDDNITDSYTNTRTSILKIDIPSAKIKGYIGIINEKK